MRKVLFPALFILFAACRSVSTVPTSPPPPVTAQDVLRAHVEAAGGEAALRAITSRFGVAEITLDTPVGPLVVKLEQQIVYPGYAFSRTSVVTAPPEIPAAMVTQKVLLTPDGGWMEGAQVGGRVDIADLPAPQAAALEQQRASLAVASEELALLDADSIQVTLAEPDTLDGVELLVVEVGGESPSRRFYSKETGLLAQMEATSVIGTVTQRYSDYRTVSGIRVPFALDVVQPGQTMAIYFSELAFDRGLTPDSLMAAAEAN